MGTLELKEVYPCSLLYLISGLLEGDEENPFTGMERFYHANSPHTSSALTATRTYMRRAGQAVWSIASGNPAGLNSASRTHSRFSVEPQTLTSIVHMLKTS